MKRRILQVCNLKHSIKKKCILFWAKWTYLGWAGWWVGWGVLPPLAKHLHIKTYFTFFHHSFHSFQFEVSCKIFAALLTFSNCKLIKFTVLVHGVIVVMLPLLSNLLIVIRISSDNNILNVTIFILGNYIPFYVNIARLNLSPALRCWNIYFLVS